MASHRKETNLRRDLRRGVTATAATVFGLSLFAGAASAGVSPRTPSPPPPPPTAPEECASDNEFGLIGVNACHLDTDVSDLLDTTTGETGTS